MLKLVVLLSTVASALGAALPHGMLPQVDGRILGGTPVNITSYYYQASLQRSGAHFCSGSIYTYRVIVTVAHCLQHVDASSLRIRVGSSDWKSGGVVVGVASFLIHEGFNPVTMEKDIAVVYLSSHLEWGKTIERIQLGTRTPANNEYVAGTGWGTTQLGSDNIAAELQKVILRVVYRTQCASSNYDYGKSIRAGMYCTYSPDDQACIGDSGAPINRGGILVGMVSWGSGCDYSNYPTVISNVPYLRSWVYKNA